MAALTNLPVRVQSPEERELERKRSELTALEAELIEQELRLSTLEAELAAFQTQYLRVVGVRYAELDDLKARIAEARAVRAPTDAAAQAEAAKARAGADDSAADVHGRWSEEPVTPFDPPGELKTLYRNAARRLHPDLAANDDDRTRRHEWMTKANEAYRRGDAEALAALVSKWEASPQSVSGTSGTGIASHLVRVIRQIDQVRRRLDSIAWILRERLESDLYALHRKCKTHSDAGRDLLEEMAAALDARIANARFELADPESEAP